MGITLFTIITKNTSQKPIIFTYQRHKENFHVSEKNNLAHGYEYSNSFKFSDIVELQRKNKFNKMIISSKLLIILDI